MFIGNTHRLACGCIYWQYAPSDVGLCLLAIRTVRRVAVFISNTHRQLSAASEASSLVSSLFNISLKCYSSLSEGIRNQSGEVSVCLSDSSDLPASRSLYRPKPAVTKDTGSHDSTCVTLCKMDSVNVWWMRGRQFRITRGGVFGPQFENYCCYP